MSFVVDACVIAGWLLPDETDPVSDAVAARLASENACAPAIWWFEIRNIFLLAERRGRIAVKETADALALLTELQIEHPHDADEHSLLRLARRHRLTLYDAAYLELAVRAGRSLASSDQKLIEAAKAEGVPLIGIDA